MTANVWLAVRVLLAPHGTLLAKVAHALAVNQIDLDALLHLEQEHISEMDIGEPELCVLRALAPINAYLSCSGMLWQIIETENNRRYQDGGTFSDL